MIKILIADDQQLIRDSIKIILESNDDFSVTDTVANGKEALNSIEKNKPDVILMDVRMPVMDGYEACRTIRRLKREDADIPIIAMTADAFSEDIQKCLECGMNDHMAKPIDIQIVARKLKKYLI